jgi:hypothetical protein
MSKNTGMTAKDEKAGKTAKLSETQANTVNQKLKEEASAPPPTKTIKSVENAREKKKNEVTK